MTKAQAQRQLDSLCRQTYVKPKAPLTGLEKHQAELN